jgi:hypothetical protein
VVPAWHKPNAKVISDMVPHATSTLQRGSSTDMIMKPTGTLLTSDNRAPANDRNGGFGEDGNRPEGKRNTEKGHCKTKGDRGNAQYPRRGYISYSGEEEGV